MPAPLDESLRSAGRDADVARGDDRARRGGRGAAAAHRERTADRAAGRLAVRGLVPIARRLAARRGVDRLLRAGRRSRARDVLLRFGQQLDLRQRRDVGRIGVLRRVPPGTDVHGHERSPRERLPGRRRRQARRLRADCRALPHRRSPRRPHPCLLRGLRARRGRPGGAVARERAAGRQRRAARVVHGAGRRRQVPGRRRRRQRDRAARRPVGRRVARTPDCDDPAREPCARR